jgi:hypothetical protein
MTPTRIDNWYTSPDDPFMAPEMGGGIHLCGIMHGHPKIPDGEQASTSTIVKVEGRVVTTHSGNVYRLGRPSRKWLGWLREKGLTYDGKRPIKVNQ